MTIIEFLQEHGIAYAEPGSHRHVSRLLSVDCPSCSPDSGKYKLGLGRYNAVCWSCGKRTIVEVLSEITGLPWGQVRSQLELDDQPIQEETHRVKLVLPSGIGPLLKPHRQYLRSRQFDPQELVELWGIGGFGLHVRLAWRLFVPIQHQGKVVSWTTRTTADNPMRYVSAKPAEEAVSGKAILYGEQHAGHAIIVVEGPTDTWRIGPGAVATLGSAWSGAQLAAIARHPVRAVAFDSEPAAQEQARRLCSELAGFPGRTVRVELDSSDPGSASPREVARLRRFLL